jgi:hypothetical protein
MAILPGDQELERELAENPRAGPKPITLEEYRQRKTAQSTTDTTAKQIRPRGGKRFRIKQEIKNYFRLIKIARTEDEKRKFRKEISKLRKQEKQLIRELQRNKKEALRIDYNA